MNPQPPVTNTFTWGPRSSGGWGAYGELGRRLYQKRDPLERRRGRRPAALQLADRHAVFRVALPERLLEEHALLRAQVVFDVIAEQRLAPLQDQAVLHEHAVVEAA